MSDAKKITSANFDRCLEICAPREPVGSYQGHVWALKGAVDELRRTVGKLLLEAAGLEQRARALESLRATLNPCPTCSGSGKLTEWIFQDESRTVGCGTCNGTGKETL